MKVLRPQRIFQPGDLAKGLRNPREFDFEGQWGLITELPQDWLWRNLGLALVGGATLSKSLIQFSLMGGLCSLFVVWPQAKHGRSDGGNGPPSKGCMPGLFYLVPLTLQQATIGPRLCRRLLDTHRHV